jgi:chlorite dismutase
MSESPEKREGGPPTPGLPDIDVREWGGKKDGERQVLDRRLFMQLTVYDVERSTGFEAARNELTSGLRESNVPSVVYEDVNAPARLGILTWSEDPADFLTKLAYVVRRTKLCQQHEYTMLGRSYSIGHEPELEHALLRRPVEYVLHAGWDWGVWYPLRRNGAFEKLEKHDQSIILREHASIGMAYGRTDLAHDVRLACHGLDAGDNEFVIGLIGKDLHPLSHLVQTMRHTRQTSEFISKMGPFFVGRAVFRNAGGPA